MKKILLLFSIFTFLQNAHAQLNIELVGQLSYNQRVADVWGYTHADGTEYAMVGLLNGVSFVSLADPENPTEVVYLEGDESRWRDLRTFGDYAYVVADQPDSENGLWVIDMTPLPDSVVMKEILYTFVNDTLGIDTLFTSHNVWVDEKGFAYLTGCDVNTGGVIMFDLNEDPMNPEFVGFGKDVYSHDNYVRGDTLYTSEINLGQFAVYDVSDKSNVKELGVQETPFRFTHNVWLSDNSKVLFTTDEKNNAPVTAYDVSDPNDIYKLDEFRPAATLGTGVAPHNVHVLNDYLVISYYTDGCIIVDAHEPDNLIEVGNYDTSFDFTMDYHGAWGAYPYFPSGLIAISDIENGLFILRPTYQRASYLEGRITDINSGIGIPNAEVSIQATVPSFETSNLGGNYKTGLASSGTFNVTFHATGYFSQTILTTISKGEVTVLDVQLVPLPRHLVAGTVVDEMDGTGIEDAVVFIVNDDFSFEATTDADGHFTLSDVVQGGYEIYVGKWGYGNLSLFGQTVKQDDDWLFELPRGYADNFNTDLGWQVDGDATNGTWVRDVPFGTSRTFDDGITLFYNPRTDSPWDEGGRCFVTGNTPLNDVHEDQVDDGATILTSPIMELASRYEHPFLSYDIWWFTVGSHNEANDTLRVWITNGADTVMLEEYGKERRSQDWLDIPEFDIESYISITDEMQLFLTISDSVETPNVIEVGMDNFIVTEGSSVSQSQEVHGALVDVRVFPNPFRSVLTVEYEFEKDGNDKQLTVYNILGEQVEVFSLKEKMGVVRLNAGYPSGTYFLHFLVNGESGGVVRVLKF